MFKSIRHLFQEELADLSALESKKETAVEEPVLAEKHEEPNLEIAPETFEQPILQEEPVVEENFEQAAPQYTDTMQVEEQPVKVDEVKEEAPVSDEAKGETILELAIDAIQANPFQPRLYFDPAQLEELASSIKEYGVLQPVIVRIVDGNYQLVSGERRFRASKLANKETIPALLRQLSDREVAEMALIENLQREDLNYFEEAEGYARLIQ